MGQQIRSAQYQLNVYPAGCVAYRTVAYVIGIHIVVLTLYKVTGSHPTNNTTKPPPPPAPP